MLKKKFKKVSKKFIAIFFATALIGSFVVSPPADAATPISVPISTYGIGTEVNGGTEIVYDASKNDTDNPYYFSYEASMNMTQVWSGYSLMRMAYLMAGNTVAQWESKVMEADWTLQFAVDPDYVSTDESYATPEAFQAMFEECNQSSTFFDYAKCYDVDHDVNTGVYTAKFRLEENGSIGAKVANFENAAAKPSALKITSPEGMLFVKQSDFAEGESFYTSNLHFEGYLTVQAMFVSQLPFTFTDDPENIKMDMVMSKTSGLSIIDNYRANDDILVIFRTGDTGEAAPSYIQNTAVLNADGTYGSNGAFPSKYDLDIRLDGVKLTSEEISRLTWTVEGAGGYPNAAAPYIASINNGSKVVTGLKSGVVKLTATLDGKSDSIYVVVPGDVNRDGRTNTSDSTLIQNYAKSSPKDETLLGTVDAFTLHLADIDGTGVINTADSTIIRNMSSGRIIPTN